MGECWGGSVGVVEGEVGSKVTEVIDYSDGGGLWWVCGSSPCVVLVALCPGGWWRLWWVVVDDWPSDLPQALPCGLACRRYKALVVRNSCSYVMKVLTRELHAFGEV